MLELLNVPSFDDPKRRVRHKIYFLVQLGDALEGHGEWARARQCDKQALIFWKSQPNKGLSMSVRCRDCLALIRKGKFLDACRRMQGAVFFYINNMDPGLNFTQLDQVLSAMVTIKVWAEACFLVPSTEIIKDARKVLADVAETEAIMEAYRETTLVETRREAREARGVTMTADGGQSAAAPSGKSKAAKRM